MSDDWQEAEGEGTGHHYSYLPAPSSQDPVQLLLILSTTILQDLIPVKMDIADQKLMDQGGGAQLLVASFTVQANHAAPWPGKGVYCCAVSKNAIIHQQVGRQQWTCSDTVLQTSEALLLKPTGAAALLGFDLGYDPLVTSC